jgi:hypothetical protein
MTIHNFLILPTSQSIGDSIPSKEHMCVHDHKPHIFLNYVFTGSAVDLQKKVQLANASLDFVHISNRSYFNFYS